MAPSLRLEKLKTVYSEKARDIIRIASTPEVSVRRKQLIYACLNNLCQISAKLYSELSEDHDNIELLEDAAKLDLALLTLRKSVGSQISLRKRQAA